MGMLIIRHGVNDIFLFAVLVLLVITDAQAM